MVKSMKENPQLQVLLAVLCVVATLPISAACQVLQDPIRDVVKPVEQVRERVEQRVQERLIADLELESELARAVEVVELAETTASVTLTSLAGESVWTETTLPSGYPVIEREWLVVATSEVRDALRAIGADILSEKKLASLGMTLLRFRVPEQLDSAEQLRNRLPKSASASFSRHFVYRAQASEPDKSVIGKPLAEQAKWCDAAVKIGMVDTQIMTDHAAFTDQSIVQKSFIDERLQQPLAHGTAVAGLLVGRSESYQSLLPNAHLFNGAVFYRHNALHQGAALLPLLEALNWLVASGVRVINVSLTGPDSPLFAQAVNALSNKGVLLIAAAGNNGPLSEAVYPAAYDGVIAVTAVDATGAIYRWANQGNYVDFASLGVHVTTARRDGKTGYETGTSMAAPVVTAAAACWLQHNPNASQDKFEEHLKAIADDLGAEGHDSVFGHGLITAKSER